MGFVDDISLYLALYAYGFSIYKYTAAIILMSHGSGRDTSHHART
jgi:hypothetical protein